MKIKVHTLMALAVAASLAAPFSAHAKKKDASASPSPSASPAAAAASATPAKAERPIPYYGKISAVDPAAKTFSIASKEGKVRVFKVVGTSVITKAGKPATFADIVKDEDVRGSYWKKADGSMETKSVKLGPLTPEEQAKKDAKKAAKEAKKAAAPAASATPATAPKSN